MFIVSATVALLVAGVLFVAGLRGQRIDDHPLCRRCGYDLTGKSADTTQCGECGSDLTAPKAIQLGHRVRRRGLVCLGIVLAVPSIGTLILGGWVQARHVDVTPYKPVWWLRWDLNGVSPAQTIALAELTARAQTGRLSAAQTAAIADTALAARAALAPSAAGWGAFIETARSAGCLDRPRWAAYLRQAVRELTIKVPPTRQGDPILFSVDLPRPFWNTATFMAFVDFGPLQVDGQDVATPSDPQSPPIGHWARIQVSGTSWGTSSRSPEVNGSRTRTLALGQHTASTVLQVDLYDSADAAILANGDTAPLDPRKRLTTFSLPVSTPFTITPARPTVPRVVVPAQRAAVAAAIRDVTVAQQDDHLVVVQARFDRPPVRVSFTAAVRSPGMPDLPIHGWMTCGAGRTAGANGATVASLGAAGQVDVVFRPGVDVTDEKSNLTPIWGEEVVIRGVPVTHGFR